MTGGSRVDDREPSMAQTRTPAGVIDRFGNPNALIVTSAVLDAFEHGTDQRLRFKTYDSSDTTHLDRSESRIRKVVLVVAANSLWLIGERSPLSTLAQISFTIAR